jgi:hypothetical protein
VKVNLIKVFLYTKTDVGRVILNGILRRRHCITVVVVVVSRTGSPESYVVELPRGVPLAPFKNKKGSLFRLVHPPIPLAAD